MKDTIAAVATPAGTGALGIIRISGPRAGEILEAVAPGCRAVSRPRRMIRTLAREPHSKAVLDEVMCFFAPGPGTATGEDCSEIHGHGGSVVLQSLLQAALHWGARLANPGEFTARGFENAKLDLTQAEAIMALIGARSDRAAKLAARHMAGSLGYGLGEALDGISTVRARLEAALDFPDEDLPDEETAILAEMLKSPKEKLTAAKNSFAYGHRVAKGTSVAIIGPANAGKSSLLNFIVEEDRALVDSTPGTTRDVVEASGQVGGIACRFLDTAGLRATDESVERRGQDLAVRTSLEADLVLLVLDGANDGVSEGFDTSFIKERLDHTLLIMNKCDLPTWRDQPPVDLSQVPRVAVSAVTGQGIEKLREEMAKMLSTATDMGDLILTTERQHRIVEGAVKHVDRAKFALEGGGQPELAATDLRWAAETLSSLFGRNASEEMLDEIFSSFCLGK